MLSNYVRRHLLTNSQPENAWEKGMTPLRVVYHSKQTVLSDDPGHICRQ